MLVQDTGPRGFWKLARVSKLFTGKDGQVRGAELNVASPGKQALTMHRPCNVSTLLSCPVHPQPSLLILLTSEIEKLRLFRQVLDLEKLEIV